MDDAEVLTAPGITLPVRRRHVLVVTDASSFSGAEIALCRLLAALSPALSVSVLAGDERVGARIASARPSVGLFTAPIHPGPVRLGDVTAYWKVLRRLAPDLVQVNLRSSDACRAALVASAAVPGLPIVAVEHLPTGMPTRAGRLLDRLISARVGAYVAVGQASARMVEQVHRLPPGTVRVIHNAVPCRNAATSSRRPGGARIVTVARLEHEKGVDVLLEALASLPGVHLTIAGEGALRADLEALAECLGISSRVRFAGWVEDVPALLAAADAFVLPSRHEGLPLAVLEAMASGCPVVATAAGSTGEALVDGETGLMVEPDQPAELARAICRMLRDADLARGTALRARELVGRSYTAGAMAAQYEALYARLWRPLSREAERPTRGATTSATACRTIADS